LYIKQAVNNPENSGYMEFEPVGSLSQPNKKILNKSITQ
jgi:hypothetical protein